MPKWKVVQERRSTIEVEVDAESESEAIEIGMGQDGVETDNWLYDAHAKLINDDE